MNKKSRSNGGTRRRPSFEEGGAPQSQSNSMRNGPSGQSYDNNRRPKPNHNNSGNGSTSHFHGLHDKNMNMAREALNDGDRIASEYYFQNAEHYLRMMNERRRHHAAKQQQAQEQQNQEKEETASQATTPSEDTTIEKPLVEEVQPE